MRIAIALWLLACLVPVAASAQAPPFLAQWGSFGTGPGQFQLPVGVAIATDGTVFVADQLAGRVLAFTATGEYLRMWSTPDPACIAVDASGRVWVGDHETNRVRAFGPDGTPLQDWASPGYRVALDPSGNVWVLDFNGNRVCLFAPNGTLLTQWGTKGLAPGQLVMPASIAVDHAGNVYVGDNGQRIQVFSTSGVYVRGWSSPQVLNVATRLALQQEITILATDTFNDRIVAFDPYGAYLYTLGGSGTGPGQFLNPIGVAVSPSGLIYVADTNNGRIQMFGDHTTAASTTSWGALKQSYR